MSRHSHPSPEHLQLCLLGNDVAEPRAAGSRCPSTVGCRGNLVVRCDHCGFLDRLTIGCDGQCPTCPWRSQARTGSTLALLPRVPVRHWNIGFPPAWRPILARQPELLRAASATFVREIFDYLRQETESRTGGRRGTHGGAVAAVHRTDAALRLNLHLHALVLDGVYSVRGNEGPVFHPLIDDPGYEQVASIAGRVADKIRGLMRRRGLLPTEVPGAPEAPEALPLEQCVTAGPPAVGVERRTRVEVDADRVRGVDAGQVASRSGVRIRAGSAVEPEARDALVRLANYVTRPEPTGPRIDARTLDLQTEGNILHKLERPFADGTTHVEFSPEALAARLREVTPGPRTPRVQYHGILAPRAAHRWRVVPGQLALFDPSEVPRQRPSEDGDDLPRPRPARVSPGRVKPGDPALRCPRCRIPMEVNTVEEHAEIEQAG